MSGTLANIAAMTVTGTPGTGTITLNAAVSSYITFADAGVVDGDIVTYMALDGSSREIGTATYTASGTTLSSRSVLNSTNSNAAISLTSAAKIYLTAAAQDLYTGAMYPKFTRPRDADFSWTNQGGASVTVNANGGIYLLAPASGSDSHRIRRMAAPSTPYTITAAFIMNLCSGGNATMAGLGFRQNSDGKLAIIAMVNGSTFAGNQIEVTNWTNETTFSALVANRDCFAGTGIMWFRITDNGTDRIFSYSFDGYKFGTLYTITRTTFLTADQVIFQASTANSSADVGATLLSWAQT